MLAGSMKRLIAFVALVCVPVALAQSGGGYDLTWSTIDGGGGTSTGGGFELSGTIGQPDASAANAMTGGNYALTGGFWGVALPVCTTFVSPDFDQDCDVDGDDFDAFVACAAGPTVPFDPTCTDKDLDGDNDADQEDYAVLQRCLSGAGIPPRQNCDD